MEVGADLLVLSGVMGLIAASQIKLARDFAS
jgi:hypothetical protein